ncbi:putative disease resistance RPP13-like protein 1 isoform X3 [Rutidosis leptorrhynchoides]|uniref:putative disease resistance RPP13-like protein 1 isoform X3 n=1 Tax=Rutidosis leptorrhynchoides TaxID=125765 RepID=UPI003A9A1FAC
MAEIVLTSAVTALFEKLLSVDLMKLTHSEGIESQLQNLKTKWRYFEAVLADASERLITEESVKVWLQDLHSLAYDLEDVLDDMATEIMRRKLNDDSRGRTSTGTASHGVKEKKTLRKRRSRQEICNSINEFRLFDATNEEKKT